MLTITIPATESKELWDEEANEFVYLPPEKEVNIQLEHSLISISKWESTWHKPFYTKDEKTTEETIDYIRCMTITPNVDSGVYYRLEHDEENMKKIADYINDSMTATAFTEDSNKKFNRQIMTSEVIYYCMFSNNIPKECEKWHLNRLITLIRVFGEKNATPKQLSRKETASHYAALNAARRKKLHTTG